MYLRPRALIPFVTGVAACLSASCSSSLAGNAARDSDGSAGADAAAMCSASDTTSFQSDVMPIFAASCTGSTICHGQMGNGAEENLYLGVNAQAGTNSATVIGVVYSGLVAIKSEEDPSMNIVTAGSSAQSYLWHKIAGDQNSDTAVEQGCASVASGPNACSDCIAAAPCGVQMPLGSTLTASEICVLENWIDEGAPDN